MSGRVPAVRLIAKPALLTACAMEFASDARKSKPAAASTLSISWLAPAARRDSTRFPTTPKPAPMGFMIRTCVCSGVPMGTTSTRLIVARAECSKSCAGNSVHAARMQVRRDARKRRLGNGMAVSRPDGRRPRASAIVIHTDHIKTPQGSQSDRTMEAKGTTHAPDASASESKGLGHRVGRRRLLTIGQGAG